MAATVHVGRNENVRYINNTGSNVRIIIYYLKITDTSADNPFYMSYGDVNQLAGNGRPTEMVLYDTGYEYIPEGSFTEKPTTAITGSGTGLLFDGYIQGEQIYTVAGDYEPRIESGSGNSNYAIGDTFSIGESNDGGNSWTPGKGRVTDIAGNECVRIGPFSNNKGVSIGSNLASSGYNGEQTNDTFHFQNANPYLISTGNGWFTYPTQCYISNGQAFELMRVGSASSEFDYNFVAIPEGG